MIGQSPLTSPTLGDATSSVRPLARALAKKKPLQPAIPDTLRSAGVAGNPQGVATQADTAGKDRLRRNRTSLLQRMMGGA